MLQLLSIIENDIVADIERFVDNKILELEKSENFSKTVYSLALVEPNENVQLQLYTWAADLGNLDAINYIHTHREIGQLLAERLDPDTYFVFKKREKYENNRYSLYMLGIINNVVNNPEFWGGSKPEHNKSQGELAIEYYTKAVEKKNPLAMIDLAHFLECFSKDHSEQIKSLVKEASQLNFPVDQSLQKYLN